MPIPRKLPKCKCASYNKENRIGVMSTIFGKSSHRGNISEKIPKDWKIFKNIIRRLILCFTFTYTFRNFISRQKVKRNSKLLDSSYKKNHR